MNGLQFFVHDDPDAVRVELAGSLRDANVETVFQAWQRAVNTNTLKPVIVDITFITEADKHGRALLVVMHRFGSRIIAQLPESSAIARPIVTEPIEIARSTPRWRFFLRRFHRLILFLLEERPAGAALPAHAENFRHASAGSRNTSIEYTGLGGAGVLEDAVR